MNTENVLQLREQLRQLLQGGHAHMTFDQAVAGFPMDQINSRPPHVAYTPWHLLEHIRRTQFDILDFIRNPQYTEGRWPEDYWPARDERADEAAWQKTLDGYRTDLQALIALTYDSSVDLFTPLAHGDGQNILRELQVVADHTAYHVGEFAILRQVMQTWGKGHEG